MGVAGQAIPMLQFTPFCSFDLSPKKSNDSRLIMSWGCAIHANNPKISITSTRHPRNSALFCRCSANGGTGESNSNLYSSSSSLEWDWVRWNRYFSEIEQAENFASVLKFQLEEAVEKEDFEEAAKLKLAIAETAQKDSVAEIMHQLKSAIEEERYQDASMLCKCTGSGLVGWWVGYSQDSDDPFGRLIRITPGVGRFIGRGYSPRQLVTASPGTPLFEIFIVKDDEERYVMQVVYMQRSKGNSKISTSPPSEPSSSPSTSGVKNQTAVDIPENVVTKEESEEKGVTMEEATEEGIKGVINFLKDKIPGLKVKVMNTNVPEEVIEDANSVKQLMQEDSEKTGTSGNSEDEMDRLDEIQPEAVSLGENSDASDDEKDLDVKLYIGGVVHNSEETPTKDEFVRHPAFIQNMDRDSFVLHIPERSLDLDTAENKVSKVKVAALAAQGVSELMPADVAKVFWGVDKVSPKISRNVREIVKRAVSQAQKRSKLSEYTTFNRITTASGDLDPFDAGLYVGAFGPYGTEVVQLRRKFGHWNDLDNKENTTDIEFFEYVEAVKLTGDLNLPAGQVTFRAKIGRGNRNANRGMYPDELGVVASYKGQGRIAEFGFRNPQWVDGELLQLNGRGIGPYVKGADLGFLYVVPEHSFLVLFNRLKLPE
ncbi:protein EXECUTER 2 [Cucumis melo var. makuwa]|uniref:Protein EXECUTER 2 n=1 Tax=Cucumis melo var. makuwa TaxID=1194695 RepID=A0A5A7URV2_CUCMM|nr:protein EXECUTER 2 [Cucumis melo var. makuwa]